MNKKSVKVVRDEVMRTFGTYQTALRALEALWTKEGDEKLNLKDVKKALKQLRADIDSSIGKADELG